MYSTVHVQYCSYKLKLICNNITNFMTTPKKPAKSSKAAKAEFDRVITALEKENEVFHTSPDQRK